MKKLIFAMFALAMVVTSCNDAETTDEADTTTTNPFLSGEYGTEFNVPNFDNIKEEHYMPAFVEAMKQHKEEIDALVANEEPATFENTIEALEFSGKLLNKVANVFYNMNSTVTNENMQSIATELSPLMSAHGDDISLNAGLFARVKAVYEQKESLNLDEVQTKLLDETYKSFDRNGANLNADDQAKLREINTEMSSLSLQFGQNVLAETNSFQMVLETEEELAGLPESVRAGAAEAATEAGFEGKWLFTIQRPSLYPFITYSENRALREKLFKGYINRGDNDNEFDNKKNVAKMLELRIKRANLFGYESHAAYVLAENMAKNADNVLGLLNQVWEAALPVAKNEAKDLQAMIDSDGGDFQLEAWDWWYYTDKLRKEKYDLNDEMLRPYFKLENVRDGAFDVCNNLWGLVIEERTDIPKYHADVQVFEVKEADGSHIGILYMDFFPRASKRGGAWMTSFRKQSEGVSPVISTVFNFSKPVGDKPALLSFDESTTLYHELGHALHGLLSDVKYNSLSGTSVARDFVELPSQIMEHWAAESQVLKKFALHYETGEPISDELMEKMKNSSHFNQGFTTIEFTAAALLDMKYHNMTDAKDLDVDKFETETLSSIGLIPEIIVRYRSTYFSHIFAGGYSSGYYAYMWAEVLDADAFQAFKEKGDIFDKETATAFRENVLSQGGTKEPMDLYVAFRGQEPTIDALLENRGLK